jgi:hypothetical protein
VGRRDTQTERTRETTRYTDRETERERYREGESRTEQVDDDAQLVDVVVAREERLRTQQFREDAADRPHVDGLRVLLQDQRR